MGAAEIEFRVMQRDIGIVGYGLRKLTYILHTARNHGILVDEANGFRRLSRRLGERYGCRHLLQAGKTLRTERRRCTKGMGNQRGDA